MNANFNQETRQRIFYTCRKYQNGDLYCTYLNKAPAIHGREEPNALWHPPGGMIQYNPGGNIQQADVPVVDNLAGVGGADLQNIPNGVVDILPQAIGANRIRLGIRQFLRNN
jgi:hypothetical protein